MENIREGCFGVAFDPGGEECKVCILKEECKKYYELAKNNSELADTRDCFGKLYDPENRYCKICVLVEKCAQKSGKEVKKMEETKKDEVKKEVEVQKEEVGMEEAKKEKVETKTPKAAKTRGEAVVIKIGAYELDLNHPRIKVHPSYEERYHNHGNPWKGLAEEKRLWKDGKMFSGKYQVCYEWMRSVKEFSIQSALEKFPERTVRGVIKRAHPVGVIKYDKQRGIFKFVNPGEKSSNDLV